MSGAFDDLQSDDVSAEEREHSAALGRRSVARLLRLSERLNLAARLETSMTAELRPIDAATVLRAAIDRIALLEPRKSVSARLEAPTVLKVTADAALLATVAAELVTNGIKHARSQVVVHATDDGFTVEDDGEGVSEPKRAGLFEGFVTRDSRSGLGLGLWLARELATAQGMSLALDPDRSTRFVVRWRA